jgi:multisubunit Na+/H+ antiporter MnhG subunit
MGIILVLLILALIFGGLGFAIHALWIVAVVLLIAWVVAFALGRGRSNSARG